MPRISIKIFGRVQGVFFRIFIEEQARKLGLVGLVKNASDGTVEAVIEGDEEDLKKMLDLCKQGSSYSKVEKIEEKWSKAMGEFEEFSIEY